MGTKKKKYTLEARYIGTSELDHVQTLREWHDWGNYRNAESLQAALNLMRTQATTCQRYEFRIKKPTRRKK